MEGALDAIAVTCAGAGRYAGVAPSGTALTPAQVAVLDQAVGPLAERGVLVAFDADPAGRDAALRAYGLLRAAGAWPTAAALPDGHDPASLAQHQGAGALLAAFEAAAPLADLVVDARMDRWSNRLHWAEGRVGAARDAAALIAIIPPEHVGHQVLRVADRLGLEHTEVTGAVVDIVTRESDAGREAWGRIERRDRRKDLDRGQHAGRNLAAPWTAAQLARTAFPTSLRATSALSTPLAGAADGDLPSPPQRQQVCDRTR